MSSKLSPLKPPDRACLSASLHAPLATPTSSIVNQLDDMEGRRPCVAVLSFTGHWAAVTMCLISQDYMCFRSHTLENARPPDRK